MQLFQFQKQRVLAVLSLFFSQDSNKYYPAFVSGYCNIFVPIRFREACYFSTSRQCTTKSSDQFVFRWGYWLPRSSQFSPFHRHPQDMLKFYPTLSRPNSRRRLSPSIPIRFSNTVSFYFTFLLERPKWRCPRSDKSSGKKVFCGDRGGKVREIDETCGESFPFFSLYIISIYVAGNLKINAPPVQSHRVRYI